LRRKGSKKEHVRVDTGAANPAQPPTFFDEDRKASVHHDRYLYGGHGSRR
jgi:hypothetical protein